MPPTQVLHVLRFQDTPCIGKVVEKKKAQEVPHDCMRWFFLICAPPPPPGLASQPQSKVKIVIFVGLSSSFVRRKLRHTGNG
jgi:hypothetical protein